MHGLKKSSAAMLAIKRSAGVTPELNVRNPLHVGKEASKGSTLALKPSADVTRSPNMGISGQTKKTDVLRKHPKNFLQHVFTGYQGSRI